MFLVRAGGYCITSETDEMDPLMVLRAVQVGLVIDLLNSHYRFEADGIWTVNLLLTPFILLIEFLFLVQLWSYKPEWHRTVYAVGFGLSFIEFMWIISTASFYSSNPGRIIGLFLVSLLLHLIRTLVLLSWGKTFHYKDFAIHNL